MNRPTGATAGRRRRGTDEQLSVGVSEVCRQFEGVMPGQLDITRYLLINITRQVVAVYWGGTMNHRVR